MTNKAGVTTIVEEPVNWQDPTIDIARDNSSRWHGIFFDYGLDQLIFHGNGATLLKAENEENGVNGEMNLDIEFECSEGTYDIFYPGGRLDFSQYEEGCGEDCYVSIGLEDSSDIMLFKNNYEQKVNLNSNKAFDQATTLVDYSRLNADIDIPSRGLVSRSEAVNASSKTTDFFAQFPGDWNHMSQSGNETESGSFYLLFGSDDIKSAEVGIDSTYFAIQQFYFRNGNPGDLLEMLTTRGNADVEVQCRPGEFNVSISRSGTLSYTGFGDHLLKLEIFVKTGPDKNNTTTAIHQTLIDGLFNGNGSQGYSFDINQNIAINPGDRFWIYYFITASNNTFPGNSSFSSLVHRDSFGGRVFIQATTICDTTKAKVSLINETVSRVVEAITNDDIRFYSETFGRKDSQPYAINADTCAGMMAVTNGLNVRRKLLKDGTQPGFFLSMRQLFEGLSPIWNIGLTIEPDPNRSGKRRLRFEDWRFFYQNDVGLRFNYPTKIVKKTDPSRLFNRLTAGYNKWEAGGTAGLDELMTKRTYRLNINSISKELIITTDMICSPYTTEVTRRLDASTEDWQYDNDLFGFCLKRVGPSFGIETFLDNAVQVSNVLDSNTAYNGRITPARNVMRWFAYVMQGLRKIKTTSKLIFSSGEGNYVAALRTTKCMIEGGVIKENQDIQMTDFDDADDAKPPTFAELVEFEHPMNYNVFKQIKDQPTLKFKSVAYICNGVEHQGWIDKISYKPVSGMASVTLIPKNDIQLPVDPEPENPCKAKIQAGSVVITDLHTGAIIIDFIEEVAGASFWSWIVTKGDVPASGPGFSGTTNTHPFTVGGLTSGTWSVFIVPYCDANTVGVNYGSATFQVSLNLVIELSAVLTTGRDPRNRMILTAVANINVGGLSFKFGQCVTNTSSGVQYCRSFPGSPVPTPTTTISIGTGQSTASAESAETTAGANFGTIDKVVVYDLQGITPSQIVRAAGQTWTLEFM